MPKGHASARSQQPQVPRDGLYTLLLVCTLCVIYTLVYKPYHTNFSGTGAGTGGETVSAPGPSQELLLEASALLEHKNTKGGIGIGNLPSVKDQILARVSQKAAAIASQEWEADVGQTNLDNDLDLEDDSSSSATRKARLEEDVDTLVAADMAGMASGENRHHLMECSCDCERDAAAGSVEDARCACSCDHNRIQTTFNTCPNHGRLEALRRTHAQLRRCPSLPIRPLDQLAAAAACTTPSNRDPAALPLGSLPVFVDGARNVRAVTARSDAAVEAAQEQEELQQQSESKGEDAGERRRRRLRRRRLHDEAPSAEEEGGQFDLPLSLLVSQMTSAKAAGDPKLAQKRALLPESPHDALSPIIFRSCAVVGSSERLLGAMSGADIDAHDAVWRVNGAPIGGTCAMYAGSKTHVRVLSARQVRHFASMVVERPHTQLRQLFPDVEIDGAEVLLVTRATAADYALLVKAAERAGIQVRWLTASSYADAKELLGGYRRRLVRAKPPFPVPPDAAEPSAGFLALYAALQVCETVSAYGLGGGTRDGALGARAKLIAMSDASSADSVVANLVRELQPRYYKTRYAEASDSQVGAESAHSLELERLLIGSLARTGAVSACGGPGGHGSLEVYSTRARLGFGASASMDTLDRALDKARDTREKLTDEMLASLEEDEKEAERMKNGDFDLEEDASPDRPLSARERERLIDEKQAELARARVAERARAERASKRGAAPSKAKAAVKAKAETPLTTKVSTLIDRFQRMASNDVAKVLGAAEKVQQDERDEDEIEELLAESVEVDEDGTV
ncbi:glycosyltransferase family 29 protein [Pseudoscourfieldia marina]